MREEPSQYLLDRILTVVPHLAQVSASQEAAMGFSLLRFFGEFRYGLAVKCASVCVIAVMGFCVGHLKGPSLHQDSATMASMLTGGAGLEGENAEQLFF